MTNRTSPSEAREQAASRYPWPCARRTAHGAHTAPDGVACPGVPAHPLTMIGRLPGTPEEDA